MSTPLRQKLVEDMQLHGLSSRTPRSAGAALPNHAPCFPEGFYFRLACHSKRTDRAHSEILHKQCIKTLDLERSSLYSPTTSRTSVQSAASSSGQRSTILRTSFFE